MSTRQWIEMPAISDEVANIDEPKYPVEKSALIIYRVSKAYVAFRREANPERDELTKNPDVRLLTSGEGSEFEQRLPFPVLEAMLETPQDAVGILRLGDLVRRVTTLMGIKKCSGCRKRKQFLNQIICGGGGKGSIRRIGSPARRQQQQIAPGSGTARVLAGIPRADAASRSLAFDTGGPGFAFSQSAT